MNLYSNRYVKKEGMKKKSRNKKVLTFENECEEGAQLIHVLLASKLFYYTKLSIK